MIASLNGARFNGTAVATREQAESALRLLDAWRKKNGLRVRTGTIMAVAVLETDPERWSAERMRWLEATRPFSVVRTEGGASVVCDGTIPEGTQDLPLDDEGDAEVSRRIKAVEHLIPAAVLRYYATVCDGALPDLHGRGRP